MLNIKQAAEYCNRSTSTIYRWSENDLRHYAGMMFSKPDLDKYLTKQKKGRKPKPVSSEAIKTLYLSGKTSQQIGDKFGMTRQGVLARLRKMGVEIRRTGFERRVK